MLSLVDTPGYKAADGRFQPLPATLPGALLVLLAVEARWLEREALIAQFWADLEAPEALHNLRVNLHRLKGLLRSLGCPPDALVPERGRLRLSLPHEAAALSEALARDDAAALLRHRPRRWLRGYAVPGTAFAEWAAQLRKAASRPWTRALCRFLARAWQQGDLRQAEQLFDALSRDMGDDERLDVLAVVASVDPRSLESAGLAAWLKMRAKVESDDESVAGPLPHPMPRTDRSTGAAPAPADWVGRVAECAALHAWSGPAAVVTGEPGIGKTALLARAFPGAPVLRAREGLQGLPYRPLIEWLAPRLAQIRSSAEDARSPLHPYRLDLARLLPDIAPDQPLPPLDAVTAKARLVEGLVRCLASEPLWLIDDLQWCDEPTLELLQHGALERRLRWVASARAYALAPAALRVLDAVDAAHLLLRVPLGPVSEAETGQLCGRLWPDLPWSASGLRELHRRSAGNPFAIRQWLRCRREHGWDWQTAPPGQLPPSVLELVQRRLRALPGLARQALQWLAVIGSPVAPGELVRLIGAQAPPDALMQSLEQAGDSGLVRTVDGRLECAHDLVREATLASLSEARRRVAHAQVAAWLAQARPPVEPLRIAGHWDAAGEPEQAMVWWHGAAEQARSLGRFEMARELWQRVSREAAELPLRLRAQLGLARCLLVDDLPAGRQLLQAVLEASAGVDDERTRLQIEGRCLSCLVDNTVFAGDLGSARAHADRLQGLLPRLPLEDRLHALEVLVELTMREPDLTAAATWVRQRQLLAPQDAVTLSLQAQVQWLQGDVRGARDAFEELLASHAAYASGQTLENDLGVMLYALGELPRAEEMLRRSLKSWAGVAHTQTLSSLVLGSVLTSMGRWDEARERLAYALQAARDQGAGLFEDEAVVRLARWHLATGGAEAAGPLLDAAALRLQGSRNPMLVSQYVLVQSTRALALDVPLDRLAPGLMARLPDMAAAGSHPLVRVRAHKAGFCTALQQDCREDAERHLSAQEAIARDAGLQEWHLDAVLSRCIDLELRDLEPDEAAVRAASLLVTQETAARLGLTPLASRAREARDRCLLLACPPRRRAQLPVETPLR